MGLRLSDHLDFRALLFAASWFWVSAVWGSRLVLDQP